MRRKQIFLKFVNVILILTFSLVAFSMILYRWGPESIRWSEGLYKIHETSGIIFFFVVLFHFILNWTWIRSAYLIKRN